MHATCTDARLHIAIDTIQHLTNNSIPSELIGIALIKRQQQQRGTIGITHSVSIPALVLKGIIAWETCPALH